VNIPHHDVVQNAFIVNDIEAAAWHWHRTWGIGPFLILPHIKIDDLHHRGKPQPIDFSVALAQAGSVQIELIAQHDEAPSCYRDFFPKGSEGFHHVAVLAKDYDDALADFQKRGMSLVTNGRLGVMRFCYLEAPGLSFMMELVEDVASIRQWFQTVRDAATDWDGVTNPLRIMG
jgi:Glyoxalase/Bleomycin resistance protein/Dioxygenase superfamily